MIFLSLKGLFKETFFAQDISYMDIFKLARYYYPKTEPKIGFFKQEAYTASIDISVSEELFFANFKKNTRYEINRAKREGAIFEIEEDLEQFYNYYNEFAKSKNLEQLRYETLLKYQEHIIITKVVKDDNTLTMHVHLYNEDIAMLLYSASQFRNSDDNKMRNLIGYANRLLHFEEMIYFKKLGCKVYDFGGYAYNTNDEVTQRINQFKDSFACIPQQRYIYTSWALGIFVSLKSVVNKLGIKTEKL